MSYLIADLIHPNTKPDKTVKEPYALFCDGGIVGMNDGTNPAGVYAYCWVGYQGALYYKVDECPRIWERGAIYEREGIGNNAMEYLAIAVTLASVMEVYPGWSGLLYSDSQNAIGAVFNGWACNYAPLKWQERMAAILAKLGRVSPVLLQGHPTKAELESGIGRKRGYPVSRHNKWTDDHCRDLKVYYLADNTPAPSGAGIENIEEIL